MLLEEFLRPLGVTQVDFAQRIGVSFPRLSEIVHAKRAITPDTALRLERALGVDAQTWLNLQVAWDLYHARRSPSSRQIRKIRRLAAVRSQPA
jgi:addiction module HigA family antidote